jgi:ribosomal protein S27AE
MTQVTEVVADKLVKCPRCSTGTLCFVSSFIGYDWSILSIVEKDGETKVVPSPAVMKVDENDRELKCGKCGFAVDEEHLEVLDAEACGLPEGFTFDLDAIADAVPSDEVPSKETPWGSRSVALCHNSRRRYTVQSVTGVGLTIGYSFSELPSENPTNQNNKETQHGR